MPHRRNKKLAGIDTAMIAAVSIWTAFTGVSVVVVALIVRRYWDTQNE